MRQTSQLALGLGLASALLAASPLALAVQPRHKKPPHAAQPGKSTPSDDAKPGKADDAKSDDAKPDDAKPNKSEDKADKSGDTKITLEETPTKAVDPAEPATNAPDAPVQAAADDGAKPSSASDGPEDGDVAALGRREAARLSAGRIQVAVGVSVGVGMRHFGYSDPVGYALAPYRLPVAPMTSFELEAYPAASSAVPFLRDLGLRGYVSRAFAFDSNTPQHVALETSWTRFGGELRERLIVPSAHRFEAGILAGMDASYFGIVARGNVPALLPAARSVALRFGFDARLLVAWRLSLLLGGAYLAVTTSGEIYEHFRRPRVGGLDSNAGFAVDLGSGLEARLTGRYTRYFSSFRPALGDPYVAGGALDELWQFGLGVRYAH